MDSGKLLSYLSIYMHKLYEDIDRQQKGNDPMCSEDYYIDEKLGCFLRELEKIGIDKFLEDCNKLSFEEMKQLYYFNVS